MEETRSRSFSVEISGRIESLTTTAAPAHRLAMMNMIDPNHQLSPVMKNSSAAQSAPAQANPTIRSGLREVRSAIAPTSG